MNRFLAAALLTCFASFVASTASAAKLKVPADFPTIQAAINVAGPGDEVDVSAGTYPELLLILNKSGITVRAKGTVKVVGSAFGPPSIPAFVELDSSTNIEIDGLRVTPSVGRIGIRLVDCTDCVVHDCRVTGGSSGIVTGVGERLSITGCRVTGSSGESIVVTSDAVSVTDCKVKNTGGIAAIDVTGTNAVVSGNSVNVTDGDGITVVSNGTAATLMDNVVFGAPADGIAVVMSSGPFEITGNHVSACNNAFHCVSAAGLLADNHFKQCSGAGIALSVSDVITSGNSVKKCNIGLQVPSGSNGGQHIGNKITNCTTFGIQIDANATDNLFLANIVKGSGQFDLDDESAGTNNFVANEFTTIGP